MVQEFISRTQAVTTRRFFTALILLSVCTLSLVLFVGDAKANILCSWFGRCFYESPGFKIRVVDKETGKPLADVHALAVWVQYGSYGQYPGLMAQDAVSDAGGWLVFPQWGPTRGSPGGLRPSEDPAITLYKIGYNVATLINRVDQDVQYDRTRGFAQDGQAFALSPFRGNLDERTEQLFKARGRGSPTTSESIALFGEPFLNRWRRIRSELQRQPEKYQQQLIGLNSSIKAVEEAKR